MEILIYIVIFVVLAFIGMMIFLMNKRYQFNEKYMECFKVIVENREDAYSYVCDYIKSLKKEDEINKAKVLKLYVELKNNLDYFETLNSIDLNMIFYDDKNKFNKKETMHDSDIFVLIMEMMCKAYASVKLDVIMKLSDKVEAIKEMNNYIEYNEVLSLNNAFFSSKDSGVSFLRQLVNGELSDYQYNKMMLETYQNIAAAVLAFKVQPLGEAQEESLREFAKLSLGKEILSDLRLYDKYTLSSQERAEE